MPEVAQIYSLYHSSLNQWIHQQVHTWKATCKMAQSADSDDIKIRKHFVVHVLVLLFLSQLSALANPQSAAVPNKLSESQVSIQEPRSAVPAVPKVSSEELESSTKNKSDYRDIWLLLLGWLLGILGGPLTTKINKFFEVRSFKKGVKIELWDLHVRIAGNLVIIASALGQLNRKMLSSLYEELKKHSSRDEISQLLPAVEKLLSIDETSTDYALLVGSLQISNKGKSIPILSTPYLDSKLDSVASLKPAVQSLLFNVKRCISIYNDKNLQMRDWDKMTFQFTATPKNYENSVNNSKACLQTMFTTGQELLRELNKINETI